MSDRIEIRPGRYINVHSYLNPNANKTLFFIHGLGGRSQQWFNQIDYFKSSFNIIVPDLLGHGESDKPRSKEKNLYAFSEHEADLQNLFRQYATQENILIGHSYGGALATALACMHQDEINKMILISPLPCTPSVSIPWLYRLPMPIMQLFRPLLEKRFQQLAFTRSDSKAILKSEMDAMRQNDLRVIRDMIKGMDKMPRLDISMLTLPTLLLLAAEDNLVPMESSASFYGQLPNKQDIILKNAAHISPLTQPEKVNRVADSFIAAID